MADIGFYVMYKRMIGIRVPMCSPWSPFYNDDFLHCVNIAISEGPGKYCIWTDTYDSYLVTFWVLKKKNTIDIFVVYPSDISAETLNDFLELAELEAHIKIERMKKR